MTGDTTPSSPGELTVSLNLDVAAPFEGEVDPELLTSVIRKALEAEGTTGAVEIGVVVTGDPEIQELNRDYRGIDAPTDVLSFSQLEPGPGQIDGFPIPAGEARLLGDIVISGDRVRSQAADYGHSQRRELAYLAVHGVLHLLGYDHETDEEKERMRRSEEKALASVPREA